MMTPEQTPSAERLWDVVESSGKNLSEDDFVSVFFFLLEAAFYAAQQFVLRLRLWCQQCLFLDRICSSFPSKLTTETITSHLLTDSEPPTVAHEGFNFLNIWVFRDILNLLDLKRFLFIGRKFKSVSQKVERMKVLFSRETNCSSAEESFDPTTK